MKKKILIPLFTVVGLVVIGYFAYPYIQSMFGSDSSQISYQTESAVKGNLNLNVSGTGTLRPNQTATISWQTSGRIDQITVETGDLVKTDEKLATLSKESLSNSIILAESDLVSAQNDLDNLLNSSTQTAEAYQTLVDAQQELEDATDNRESKDYQRASGETIDNAEATYLMAKNKYEDARDEYNQYADRAEDDPIRAHFLTLMVDAEDEMNSAFGNLNWLRGGPDAIEVSQADARVLVAQASLEDAQREYDHLKDGPDPDDVKAAEVKIASIEATLEQANLEAPFSGTITEISSKVGDTVNAGTVSFRIDDLSKMFVDVDISEVDINSIEVGQTVTLTFDAVNSTEYEGNVSEISRVGTTSDGTVNYNVTVLVLNPDDQIMPGMTAAVNISTSEIENAVLVPCRAVRTEDGKRILYVLENNSAVMHEITIGASADSYCQITNNSIKPGDLIILNPSDSQLQIQQNGTSRNPFGG